MTYQKLVEKVQKALTAVDASSITEHIAVQVNVTGEAEGAFYIEVADGKLAVEPYDYVDRDVLLTASEETLVAVSAGKMSVETGVAEGAIAFEGNYEKAMLLNGVLAQLPVKKTRKPAAKKAAAPKKEAAPKKAAAPKKTAAKKAEAPAAEAAAPKTKPAKKAETAAETKKAPAKKPAAKKTAAKKAEKAE